MPCISRKVAITEISHSLYSCCRFFVVILLLRIFKQQKQQIMGKSKEPIRLRQRKTSKGLTSLYLDIYLNGERSYEYLKLYLVPEKSREDKRKNAETLKLAEAIRAKRVVELQNGEFGFKSQFKEETLFFDFYEAMCKQ